MFEIPKAVSINGLNVPVPEIAAVLHQYCSPAIFRNPEFPENLLSLSGSLFLASFEGKLFAILTKHQFGTDYGFDQLVLMGVKPGRFYSADLVKFPN